MEKVATPEFVGGEAAKRVKLQLDGVPSKGGSFPCVLGPRVIGVLAHEALGHLAEADLTVNSAFNGKLGEVVASEGVNMIDDGTIPGAKPCRISRKSQAGTQIEYQHSSGGGQGHLIDDPFQ